MQSSRARGTKPSAGNRPASPRRWPWPRPHDCPPSRARAPVPPWRGRGRRNAGSRSASLIPASYAALACASSPRSRWTSARPVANRTAVKSAAASSSRPRWKSVSPRSLRQKASKEREADLLRKGQRLLCCCKRLRRNHLARHQFAESVPGRAFGNDVPGPHRAVECNSRTPRPRPKSLPPPGRLRRDSDVPRPRGRRRWLPCDSSSAYSAHLRASGRFPSAR